MRYDEFESEFPGHLATLNPATVRSWKLRGKVPDSVATALRVAKNVPASVAKSVSNPEISVANPVATEKTVTNTKTGVAKPVATDEVLQVALQSAEAGHPEFDIMEDGLARGFPGDTWQRVNRTCHALRRMAERKCGGITEDATKREGGLIGLCG